MSRDSRRFGDAFLEKFIEWVEANIVPELVYLDDEPLHNWARRNGYSRPLVTIKRDDGLHFVWPKGRGALRKRLGAAEGLAEATENFLRPQVVAELGALVQDCVLVPVDTWDRVDAALAAWRAGDGG